MSVSPVASANVGGRTPSLFPSPVISSFIAASLPALIGSRGAHAAAPLLTTRPFHGVTRAGATPFTWNGGGGDNNWTTGGNWGGSAPPTSGADVIFAGTQRLSPLLNTPYSVNSVTFDSSAGFFSLNIANSLTIGGGGIQVNGSNPQSLFGASTVSLGANQTWNVGTAGLTVSAAVTGNAALTKTGTATLALLGANTFQGLTITQGNVWLLHTDAAGKGALIVSNSGTNGGDHTGSGTGSPGVHGSAVNLTATVVGGTSGPTSAMLNAGAGGNGGIGQGTTGATGGAGGNGGALTLDLSAANSLSLSSGITSLTLNAGNGGTGGEGRGINTIATTFGGSGGIGGALTLNLFAANSLSSALTSLEVKAGAGGDGGAGGNFFSPVFVVGGSGAEGGSVTINLSAADAISSNLSTLTLTAGRGGNGGIADGNSALVGGGTAGFGGNLTLNLSSTNALSSLTMLTLTAGAGGNGGGGFIPSNNPIAGGGGGRDGGVVIVNLSAANPLSSNVHLNLGKGADGSNGSGPEGGPRGSAGYVAVNLNGNDLAVGGLSTNGGMVASDLFIQNGSGSTAATLTVGSNDGNTYIFGGTLNDGGVAALALTKTGTNTLRLTGSNSYTGATTVNGGTLLIGASASLPTSPSVVINGGTLDLNSFSTTLASLSGSGGALALGSGALTVDQTATTTFGGAITGSGSLTKAGSGTLTLAPTSGSNSYSGGTTVNGGTLSLTGLNDGNSVIGTGGLTINSGGTVLANSDNALGQAAALPSLTINGGTYRPYFAQHLFALTMTGGTVGDALAGASAIGLQADTGATITTLAAAASSSIASPITLSDAGIAFTVADGFASEDLIISGSISGSNGITKTGAGTMTLAPTSGSNSYSGGTTVNGGTLYLTGQNDGNSVVGTGILTVNTGATVIANTDNVLGTAALLPTLVLNGGTFQPYFAQHIAALTMTGGTFGPAIYGPSALGLQADSGAVVTTLASSLSSIIASPIYLNDAGIGFSVADGVATQDLVVSGAISGFYGVTKTGAGTLVLTGSNSFTGGLSIQEGTVAVTANTQLGDTGGLLNLQTGGILRYDGSFDHSHSITLGVGGGTVDTNGFDTTFNGLVSGSGGLVKSGTGTLTLKNANTFTGGLIIQGGKVVLDAPTGTAGNNYGGALQSDITVNSGGTLDIQNTDQTANTSHLTVSNGGSVNIISGHTSFASVTLGGNATIGGNTNDSLGLFLFNSAPLTATGTNNTISTPLGLSGANVVTVTGGSDTLSITGAISNSGSLTKAGSGTLTLAPTSGGNSYSGGTTVNGGTLYLTGQNDGQSVLGTGTLTVNSGGTVIANSDNALGQAAANPTIILNGGTYQPYSAQHFASLTMTGGSVLTPVTGSSALGLQADAGATVTTLASSSSSTIASGMALFDAGVTFDVANGAAAQDVVVSGSIVGANGITKTGAGTLVLTGNNLYSGGTTISSGNLVAGGAALGTGRVTINSGATLNVGSLPNISVTSQLTTSLTIDSLTATSGVGNTLPLLTFDLGTSGINDILNITGEEGAFTFSSSSPFLIGFASATGDPLTDGAYTLINFVNPVAGNVVGMDTSSALAADSAFAARAIGNITTLPEGAFSWKFNDSGQVTGLQYMVSSAGIIPEPGTLALVFFGAGAGILARRTGRGRK